MQGGGRAGEAKDENGGGGGEVISEVWKRN